MAGTSYTRQSTFSDGDTITALLFNAEYNQLLTAFSYASTGTTGHRHDGSAGEGGNIYRIGDQDFKNKIEADSAGNRWTVSVEVGGTATERVHIDVDGLDVTGNINVSGTVDGRDIAADGTKLDGIEAGSTGDQTATEIRALVESATDSNVFTDADHSKLNGIEASADVTDTANVTAAGALMDSELTSIASIKALNQGVATTDAPTFAGLTSTGDISLGDNDKIKLGTSDDLQIYHDGSNSFITENGTGNLRLSANNLLLRSDDSYIQSEDGSVNTARFNSTTGVVLYRAGDQKLSTTSTGIDVSGTVSADGLHVDNPNATVQSSTTTSLNLVGGDGNSKNIFFKNSSSVQQAKISNLGADGLAFFSGSTEAVRIDQNANLLVGTSSSVGLGDTSGNGLDLRGDRVHLKRTCTSSTQGLLHLNNIGTAGNVVEFYQDGVERGKITVSSSATSYNTSSDYRLKEDVQPLENATDRLLQLNPCNFAWKADGSRVDGFLAHEAQEVVPEAVTGEKDAMRTEEYEAEPAVYEGDVLVSEAVMAEREVPDYQAIDQSKLIPLLVATLQEQVNIIQELEARIKTLENAQ